VCHLVSFFPFLARALPFSSLQAIQAEIDAEAAEQQAETERIADREAAKTTATKKGWF
jgi:hypothetical protein